ncbi:MAG: methyltransferase domain-containing protein [Proteobacteria bacterium]|nr:methyltransferase domain-containing protein [Pseudomonadota bacterium]
MPLVLAEVLVWQTEGVVRQGLIQCPAANCAQEYPIIDGIPILMPSVREYVSAYAPMILQRNDLTDPIESLIGDCLGPDHQHNLTRYYLSSYAHDGFLRDDDDDGVLGVFKALTELMNLPQALDGPVLDLGCSVGRSTFALGEMFGALALGIDMNFSMLRLAQDALYESSVRFPRRRVGLVYGRSKHLTGYENRECVDFWACDAQSLPFPSQTAKQIIGLNVLDSVHSPLALLKELARVLVDDGIAGLATPFDWSARTTPMENWIGGHSQRNYIGGSPEVALEAVLANLNTPAGLSMIGNREVNWSSTVSDRSRVMYQDFLFAVRKSAPPDGPG